MPVLTVPVLTVPVLTVSFVAGTCAGECKAVLFAEEVCQVHEP